MEFKVKEVSGVEEKSVQQVEQELLDKHKEEFEGTTSEDTESKETVDLSDNIEINQQEESVDAPSPELSEEDVLKFIGNRYGKEITSLDELNRVREEQEPLPEDVSKYLQYKKETGRGFDDFAKLQKNYDEMDTDKLLREYLTATEKGLDAEDIEDLMEDYSYDEDLDDEKDIRKIKLAKKKTIAKAKDYFVQQQEKYKVPLESRRDSVSEDELKEDEEYKQYIANAKTIQEQNARKSEVFMEKTNSVFNEFKGFEFNIDDNKIVFSPGDAEEIKKSQLDPNNFVSKFLDEDGMMKDAEGYHRSLAMAMNPEKFAKFFYEQGKSSAADEQMKKLKNINMTTRNAPEVSSTTSGVQIKSLSNDSGRGLKIKSRKK